MALVNIREVYPGVSLGLWQMDESVAELLECYPWANCYQGDLSRFKSDSRKLEFLSVRISVSHTKGYAALILSKAREVAVDIEYYSDRVKRIASKFMRKDEKAIDLDALLVHWCSKETIYKLFSEDNLQYADMRVKPFDAMSDWSCEVENLKAKKRVNVDFELTMEFVLTYAAL